MRVAALGRSKMLLNSIKSLASAGHEITLVATCKAMPDYGVNEEDFRKLAGELDARFLCTQDLNDETSVAALRESASDVAVSVNWINLLKAEACASFPFGILNAHAGDLPRYRGNAPVAWAILQGEARIGITVHQMDPHILDGGAIVLKDYFPLSEETYIGEVFKYLEERIPRMFVEAVTGLAQKEIQPMPQSVAPELALRGYPRRPEDGFISWEKPTVMLARLVRASAEPFAGAFTFFQSRRFTIWRARAGKWDVPTLSVPGQVVWRDRENGEVAVATGDGVLILEEIEWGEAKRCRPTVVIKSLRDRLGLTPYDQRDPSVSIARTSDEV